jgi:hypothetical protein
MSETVDKTGAEDNSFYESLFDESPAAVAAKPQNEGSEDNGGDNGNQSGDQGGGGNSNGGEFLKTPKEILGEEFGENWEEVKTKVTDWKTQASEYQAKKSEIESLRSSQVNPFANEEVASFNEFVKSSKINDYATFKYIKGIDLTNIDPVEVAVANQILANPALIGKEAVIRAKVIREEGLDTENFSADEVEVNKAGFIQKVAPMIERIKGLQENKFIAPDPEALTKAKGLAFAEIEPDIKTIVSEISTIPILATDREGKESKILDYAVDAAKLEGKINKITSILVNQGFTKSKMTPEVLNVAKQSAIREIMVEDFGTIIQSVITQTKTSLEEAYDLDRHNPSAIYRGGGNSRPIIKSADSEGEFVKNLID